MDLIRYQALVLYEIPAIAGSEIAVVVFYS